MKKSGLIMKKYIVERLKKTIFFFNLKENRTPTKALPNNPPPPMLVNIRPRFKQLTCSQA